MFGYALSLFSMNIYKDFKKDPKAVAGKLVHIISIVTFGIIAMNRSDILTAPALDEKINGDDLQSDNINLEVTPRHGNDGT